MPEPRDRTFRTKTGTCTITPDRVVLTRTGVRGAAAQTMYGNSIKRGLALYGIIGILLLAFGVQSIVGGRVTAGSLPLLMGLLCLWIVIRSWNNSATPSIDRAAIRAVEAHPPRRPVTRGYFVVMFEEGGKLKKRLIALPGSIENGDEEFRRALAVWKQSGLSIRE